MDDSVIFTMGIMILQVCALIYLLTQFGGARRNYKESIKSIDDSKNFVEILKTDTKLLYSAQNMRDCEYTIEDETVLIKFKSYKQAREFEDSIWKQKKHKLKLLI